MLESLLERRILIYSLLLLAVWALGVLGWRFRQRRLLVGGGVVLLVLALFAVLDVTTPTAKRLIEQALAEMAAGVKEGNSDKIFRHLAADFAYRGQNKESFRRFCDDVLKSQFVTDLVLWETEWPDGGTDRERPVAFKAKPKGKWENEGFYQVRSTWVREADGKWRLKGFQVFNPFVNADQELAPPGIR